MKASELSPVTRQRARAERPVARPAVVEGVASDDGLAGRMAAIESTVMSIDRRLEEVAARLREFVETADDILHRHGAALGHIEATIAALPTAAAVVDLAAVVVALASEIEATGPSRDEVERRVSELSDSLARVQATVDWIIDGPQSAALHSQVDLVAGRLSTLLGGPTLTDLMDRIDELDGRLAAGSAAARRRARKLKA